MLDYKKIDFTRKVAEHTIVIRSITPDIAAKVDWLITKKLEYGMLLDKVVSDLTLFNWSVEVTDAFGQTKVFAPPPKEITPEVVEPIKVVEVVEPPKPKRRPGRPRVQPKVRQPSGTNPLEIRPGMPGRPPNQWKQQRAFEIVELLVSKGLPKSEIIHAGWKRFQKDVEGCKNFRNFYYYYRLWWKTQRGAKIKINGIL